VKLVVCIVHNRDKGKITDELVKAGFKFTVVASTGGFLREGNTTFLIGIQSDELDTLMCLVDQNCQSREQLVNVKVPVGGAVVFVLPVERFERF
jgi:uncharacterized protein YaaQ